MFFRFYWTPSIRCGRVEILCLGLEKNGVLSISRLSDHGVGDPDSWPDREGSVIECGRQSCPAVFERRGETFRTLGLYARRAGRWYARGLSLLDTGLRPLESAAQAEGGDKVKGAA